jgi:hypothetical protein
VSSSGGFNASEVAVCGLGRRSKPPDYPLALFSAITNITLSVILLFIDEKNPFIKRQNGFI